MDILDMELDLIEEPGGGYGQNVLISGVDMSFTTHIDNKKRHISIRNISNTRIRT